MAAKTSRRSSAKSKRRRSGKVGKTQTLPRQWKLLQLLPSQGPGRSVETLTELLSDAGYKVTRRTVERDLPTLKKVFPLECLTGEAHTDAYRWRWEKNAVRDIGGLSVAEALSLKLVESTLRNLLPAELLHTLEPRFGLAGRVLAELQKGNRTARWPQRVRSIPRTLELEPPKVSAQVLEAVQEALLADEQLEMQYKALQEDAPSLRVVHPHALLHKGQITYLVASRSDGTGTRLYAIHRMHSARPNGQRATQSGFDLGSYLTQEAHEPSLTPAPSPEIKLVARVSRNLAKLLRETPITKDQTLVADGDRFRITATVREHQGLRRWILGHGNAIEVLKPTSLRDNIARAAVEMAAFYA